MSTRSSRTLHQGSSDDYFKGALNKNAKDHRRKQKQEGGVSNSSSSRRNPSVTKAIKTDKTSTRYKENIVQENDSVDVPHPDSAKNLEAKQEDKTQSMLKELTILHKRKEQELRALERELEMERGELRAQYERKLEIELGELRAQYERKLEKERGELRAQFEHAAIKQQRVMEKRNADMSANYQIEYNRSLDANKREMKSIIEKVKLEMDVKIQQGVNKARSNMFPIANFPINKHGPIVSAISYPDDTWVTLCSVDVSTSPWRVRMTCQNQVMQLGENGQFMVQRNIVSQVRRGVYAVRGEVTFMSKCPDSKSPWKVLQGNASKSQICWEAINHAHTSGGTTIKGAEGLKQVAAARRFFFQFNDNASLSVVLYHMFYDSQKHLTQFFQSTTINLFTQGRFYHTPSTPQQRKDENGGVDYYQESQAM